MSWTRTTYDQDVLESFNHFAMEGSAELERGVDEG